MKSITQMIDEALYFERKMQAGLKRNSLVKGWAYSLVNMDQGLENNEYKLGVYMGSESQILIWGTVFHNFAFRNDKGTPSMLVTPKLLLDEVKRKVYWSSRSGVEVETELGNSALEVAGL